MSGYYQNTTYGLPADDPSLIRFYDQICIRVIKKIATEWGSVLETAEFNHTQANYYLVHFKNGFIWLDQLGEPIQEFKSFEQSMKILNRDKQLDTVETEMMRLTPELKSHINHSGIPLIGKNMN